MNKREQRLAAAAAKLKAAETDTGGGMTSGPESAQEAVAAVVERTEAQVKEWLDVRVALTTPEIQAAVAAGDVQPFIGVVNIRADASPTKVAASKEYLGLSAMTGKGMAALNGGRIKPALPKPEKDAKDERTAEQKLPGACDWHNYGYDLDVRRIVRAEIMATLEGPDKAVAVAIKGMRGMGWSDAKIRRELLEDEESKFKAHPAIDKIVDAALASK